MLFGYALTTIPVFVVLGLVAQLARSRVARRAMELVLLSGVAAFGLALGTLADDAVQWALVSMLALIFVVGSVMHVRSYSRSS
jgi:malonyl CoA-acyl carrier protein transacylase